MRRKRDSIKYSVDLNKGIYGFFTIISKASLLNEKINLKRFSPNQGEINCSEFGRIFWDLKKSFYFFIQVKPRC